MVGENRLVLNSVPSSEIPVINRLFAAVHLKYTIKKFPIDEISLVLLMENKMSC